MNGEAEPMNKGGYNVTLPEVPLLSPEEEQAAVDRLMAQFEIKDQMREEAERFDDICKDYATTDFGNSQRLIRRYGKNIRYCKSFREWIVWDQNRWIIDQRDSIKKFAKHTVLRIGAEAIIGGDKSKELFSLARDSQSDHKVNAMISLSGCEVPIVPEEMDRDPHLLNLQNGTMDLQTGIMREHRRDDYITKITGTGYSHEALCPIWEDHLRTVFDGDEEFISAFQEMAGYCLLSNNPEQIIFVAYGSGQNGKSVTLNTLRTVFGEYCCTLPAESLMAQKFPDATKGRADLAVLRGARLAIASESDKGTVLSEAMIKIFTGGEDELSIRTPYGKYQFSFVPGAKIWLITNHLPRIKGTDMAIWRRIWVIPFTFTIPEEKKDPNIGKKLISEAPGILAWCIRGLRRYFATGRLSKPDKVSIATEEYRADQDVLGDFLSERCTIEPQAIVYASDLFRTYTEWCTGNEVQAMSKTAFGNLIKTRYQKGKDRVGWYYKGLRLSDRNNLIPPIEKSQIKPEIKMRQVMTSSLKFPETPQEAHQKKFFVKSNNLSQLVTIGKEDQIEENTEGARCNSIHYNGMSRDQLTEILMQAGGKRENLSDPESWENAWKAAGPAGA